MRRIVVIAGARIRLTPNLVALEDELRRLGHIDGGNTAIDYVLRSGELTSSALTGDRGTDQRRHRRHHRHWPRASTSGCGRGDAYLPIVMVAIDYDLLTKGYIASLARPGGNITGVFLQQIELTAKRLELLNMRRVALL